MFKIQHIKKEMTGCAPHIQSGPTKKLSDQEMHQWAFDRMKYDLDVDSKIVTNLSIKTLGFQDVNNERYVTFLVEYDQEVWTGSRSGVTAVYKQIIKKDALTSDTLYREWDDGYRYVRRRIPEAVHRIGCYCCSPDGPDLESNTHILFNGDLEITYTVDWDFCKDEHI